MDKEYTEILTDLEDTDDGGLNDAYADSLEEEFDYWGEPIKLEELDLDEDFDPIIGEVGESGD